MRVEVEKLPAAVPEAWLRPVLMTFRPVAESTRFAILVDTSNGNGHPGGVGVANGIRYGVGETICG